MIFSMYYLLPRETDIYTSSRKHRFSRKQGLRKKGQRKDRGVKNEKKGRV